MFASLNITTKTKARELITFLEFYCMCITDVSGNLKRLLSGVALKISIYGDKFCTGIIFLICVQIQRVLNSGKYESAVT